MNSNSVFIDTISKNIKSLRQWKNWTQEQVAAQLEISAPAFSKIESGDTNISLIRLDQIAQLFGLSAVELITYNCKEDQRKYTCELKQVRHELEQREAEIIDLQKKLISVLEKHNFFDPLSPVISNGTKG